MTARKIIHLIMAARPNIMKIAPLYHALQSEDWAEVQLIHTGQHYDDAMSGSFLRDFDLPAPHHHLGIGSGTHAEQTGHTMIAYEALCQTMRPHLSVVAGDVNATIACALAAKKLGIPIAHLEAGLRSFDRTMPEEINRLATDAISDYLWTPSNDATTQLLAEGIAPEKIAQVGNVMIDAYCRMQDRIAANGTYKALGLGAGHYAVMTFHRPANVDDDGRLNELVAILEQAAAQIPIVLPLHPRTRARLENAGLLERLQHPMIKSTPPLPYATFMNLVSNARVVVTDSGGIQEETSYLGIPCLTLRNCTERPVTIIEGTNHLTNFKDVIDDLRTVLIAPIPPRPIISGWDGLASTRIIAHLKTILHAPAAIHAANSRTAA